MVEFYSKAAKIAFAPWFPKSFHLRSRLNKVWLPRITLDKSCPPKEFILLFFRSKWVIDLFPYKKEHKASIPVKSLPPPKRFHSKFKLFKLKFVFKASKIFTKPLPEILLPFKSIKEIFLLRINTRANFSAPSSPI
jgi:hypothetical protein